MRPKSHPLGNLSNPILETQPNPTAVGTSHLERLPMARRALPTKGLSHNPSTEALPNLLQASIPQNILAHKVQPYKFNLFVLLLSR